MEEFSGFEGSGRDPVLIESWPFKTMVQPDRRGAPWRPIVGSRRMLVEKRLSLWLSLGSRRSVHFLVFKRF